MSSLKSDVRRITGKLFSEYIIKDGTAFPVGSGSALRYLDTLGELIVNSDIPAIGGPWPEGSRTLFKKETVNVAEMKMAYYRRQTQLYQRLRKFMLL
jgi:hypothetical protein